MRKAAWAAFWVLGLVWGSSFLLIRISVQEINPFELVFIRTGIAAVGLLALARLRGMSIPTDWATLVPLIVIGIGNTAVPFFLISWGETIIDSSMASILQATASLFTLVIAHFFIDDERMTPQRIGGMIAGFIGVVILFGVNIEDGRVLLAGLVGQLAIVLASMFYATFTTYSRLILRGHKQKMNPVVVAGVTMASAAVVMGAATVLAPLLGGPSPSWFRGVSTGATLSALTLGVFNTLFAYALFYYMIDILGAARSAMVTYVVPVVGLVLGVIYLNEPLGWNIVLGAALIMGGIGIVNLPNLNLRRNLVEPVPSEG